MRETDSKLMRYDRKNTDIDEFKLIENLLEIFSALYFGLPDIKLTQLYYYLFKCLS